ncbi:MAG: hypothetical protein ACLFRG_03170 [Desulfococcaceae bacterium]
MTDRLYAPSNSQTSLFDEIADSAPAPRLSASGSKPCGDPPAMGVSNPPNPEDHPQEPEDGEVDTDYWEEPKTRTEDPDYVEEPLHGEEEPGFIDEPRGEEEGDYVEEPHRDIEDPGYREEPPPEHEAAGRITIPAHMIRSNSLPKQGLFSGRVQP